MFCPERITSHTKHDFIRSHLLYKATGFCSLSRIYISQTGILVSSKHTSRYLPKYAAHQMVYSIRSFQICRITTKHIISSRLTERLSDIYIMPVRQCRIISPVGSITVYLLCKLQQEFITRPVVKPINTVQIISSTTVFPIILQEILIRYRHLPFEIVSHKTDNPLITGIFIIGLQTPEHNHLCPKFAFAVTFIDRTEIAIRLATGNSRFNPSLSFSYHCRIIQNICHIAISLQPVRNFLPTMIATGE